MRARTVDVLEAAGLEPVNPAMEVVAAEKERQGVVVV
jgi:hypothetical protein